MISFGTCPREHTNGGDDLRFGPRSPSGRDRLQASAYSQPNRPHVVICRVQPQSSYRDLSCFARTYRRMTKTVAHSTELSRNTFHITHKTSGNVLWANSKLSRFETFRVLENFPIGILSSIGRWRQLLEHDTQQLMFSKYCCISITL